MATTYRPRSAWTSTPAKGGTLTRPRGFAVHWPGSTSRYAGKTAAQIAAALEGFRRFHVSGNGWSDIAYQVAIDQAGRVWDLRGILRKSAANGDATVNGQWGALLLLLGPGESVTPAMAAAISDWRETRWLAAHPAATEVTTHSRVRSGGTTCPGPAASGFVYSRGWEQLTNPTPPKPEETDMAAEDADRVIDEVHRTANNLDARLRVIEAQATTGQKAANVAARGVAELLGRPVAKVDAAELAALIPDEFAADVADELAARLGRPVTR